MKQIIIIGTIHGSISTNEITEIIERFNPDQIMIEVRTTDIEKNNFEKYPSEMKFAFEVGKAKNKLVTGFEDENEYPEIKLEDLPTEERMAIERGNDFARNHDWKEFNKREVANKLKKIYGYIGIIDKQEKLREPNLLKNIIERSIEEGIILVFCGAGHLEYFEKELPETNFPYR